jgi:2,4-dienoyl-CoA reductase-like NADH-dependent reductase (Old Yellow Enzyme family)
MDCQFIDMGEPTVAETKALYGHLISECEKLNIGYIQLMRYIAVLDPEGRGLKDLDVVAEFRPMIKNAAVLVNGDYDGAKAEAAVTAKQADAIAFGRPFIANPDFPDRVKNKVPLAADEFSKWYGVHAADGSIKDRVDGYTSYLPATVA